MNMTPETNTHTQLTPPSPEIAPVPSLGATPTFLVIRPSPDLWRSDLQQLFYCDQKSNVDTSLLLSTNISKKTVISKLIALALLADRLPQIRTLTELQTPDNQDSRQHNSLDIVHEIFVKITLLSNSHSESFYLF